jgi:hypothetical protein
MTKQKMDLMKKYRDLKKSMGALKQRNMGTGQILVMMKEFGVWWKVIRNLKELEGSWTKAIGTYVHMFKSVP